MSKLVPLGDRLVLRPIDEGERVTKRGIIIPGTATEKPQVADVIACGEEVTKIKTGNKVMYAYYAGQSIRLNEVDYVVLAEEDVLCRVDD